MWLYPKVMGFNPSERWGHSACYFNGFIYVFGGCCGGLHFSDVIMLNLDKMVWTTLVTTGTSPGPRDSHSAALFGHKMIVFGGTNGSKKVNDLHILDLRRGSGPNPIVRGSCHPHAKVTPPCLSVMTNLKAMRWTSPEVKGNFPVPRDSHSAVAIGSKIFVYGGDCGDRYEGDIDVLDMDTLTWSRVYVIGGVGDKQYYNDVWVLDVNTALWTQLEIRGQQPQGRFSHTAIVTGTDIAIYGGCGEDEHPVNELLVLQLGAEHPNGRYNISMCKIFGNHCTQQKRRLSRKKTRIMSLGNIREAVRKETRELDSDPKKSLQINSDALHTKRKKMSNSKTCEIESEPEEHSLSLSQHSSPSQSDQEQAPEPAGFPVLEREQPNQPNSEQHLHVVQMGRHEAQHLATEQKPVEAGHFQTLVGADIRGKIDGAFDSGYLMTAVVNGKIFRGVLFAPVPEVVSRSAIMGQNPSISLTSHRPNFTQPCHISPTFTRHPQQPTAQPHMTPPSPVVRSNSSVEREPKIRSDLQGVVLTLGGPGGGHGGS
ncbi:hypothetical protein Acr_00g0013470 [Actinidia rufa]|uniref:Galactose oxidase/kelch repeat superfamily protein n=1 Tax=Actinidia rufa TaxID=165716 RepID=A0A7J0DAM4_9ERIC|nr:hypothetical protein Acr_00g0013470 [Actinidia rufa]